MNIEQAMRAALQHRQAGQHAQAEKYLQHILAINPNHVPALIQLASLAQDFGHSQAAAELAERAIALQPNEPIAYLPLGAALRSLGRYDDAVTAMQKAIALNKRYWPAYVNLGVAHYDAGRNDLAESAYRKAIQLNPDSAEAQTSLGILLCRVNRLDEALMHTQRAVQLNNRLAEAHLNLGNVLRDLAKVREAIDEFQIAHNLNPADSDSLAQVLNLVNYLDLPPQQILNRYKQWSNAYTSHIDPQPINIEPTDGRRLRVGYVSPDFFEHPVARFIEPIVAHHDRSAFEIFCYHNSTKHDAATDRLKKLADHWHDVVRLSDAQLAELIRQHRIDILIDLAGFSPRHRLMMLAHKPAPVQISYLAHPATLALSAVEYRITDPVTDPPGNEAHYTEKLLRLECGFSCYEPPASAPEISELPAMKNGYITFGSLHKTMKLNAPVLDLWAKVVLAVPNSKLLLFRDTLTGSTRSAILKHVTMRGVAADRVIIENTLPAGQNWMAIYQRIDISLDVFPWTGHTTALRIDLDGCADDRTHGKNARPADGRFRADAAAIAGVHRADSGGVYRRREETGRRSRQVERPAPGIACAFS